MVVMDAGLELSKRSREQQLTALELANEIRSRRSRLKRNITAGRESAAVVILAPPEWAATMRVIDLLLAIRYVGRKRAVKVLGEARLPSTKSVGGLTPRQRAALVDVLGRRGL
jgi:hypothetical protein